MIPADHIERARAVPIEHEIMRRGIRLKRAGAELIGPCPCCGGTDRFGVHTRKQVFNCRGCGAKGDVIALVQHLDRSEFRDAIATLAGERKIKKAPPQAKSTKPNDDGDERASKAAWLWSQRKPVTEETPPWLYLRKRGYTGPIPATFGYLPARDSYPAAMIAAFGMAGEPEPGILAAPKRVTGVHLTRLAGDGDKAPDASGKAKIMLGVCKGSPITISPPNDLLGMAVTEGIEDGLSCLPSDRLGRMGRRCCRLHAGACTAHS